MEITTMVLAGFYEGIELGFMVTLFGIGFTVLTVGSAMLVQYVQHLRNDTW